MCPNLEHVLGQDLLIDEITSSLQQSKTCHVLHGPAGSGKSRVLRRIAEEWAGIGNTFLLVAGDRQQSARPYFPFFQAFASAPSKLHLRRFTKRGLSEAGTLVPIAGDLISFALDALLNYRERNQAAKAPFLSEKEHEIMFYLQSMSSGKDFLLVADDIQYWDNESVNLLRSFMSPRLEEIYPFLGRSRLLTSYTDGSWTPPRDWHSFIAGPRWRTQYAKEHEMAAILAAFGAPRSLPQTEIRLIYSVCAGHLEIIRRLAEYLATEGKIASLASSAQTYEGLLAGLLENRIERLGPEGEKLAELLRLAAIAGTHIFIIELKCLADANDDELIKLLPRAEDLDFLRRDGEKTYFSHEVIQRYFSDKVNRDNPELHETFAQCITWLRPSDYTARSRHLRAAGKTHTANYLDFLSYLQSLRSGNISDPGALQKICNLAGGAELANFYQQIDTAYKLFNAGKIDHAKSILQSLEDIFPVPLLAEKDYLLARCLKKSASGADKRLGRKLLESWIEESRKEGEQWFRIVSMLIVMQANEGNFHDAKINERMLARYLSERVSFDPFAESGLNILRRRCAALHSCEIAAQRCRNAVQHFGPSGSPPVPRNPRQWYMSLVNLAGNLIMSGSFEEASHVSRMATELPRDFPLLRFPKIEVALNNLAIASYMSNKVSAAGALAILDAALRDTHDKGELVLMGNNAAALKILAGDISAGMEDLSSLQRWCMHDDFYSYFILCNLISASFIKSGNSEWRNKWKNLKLPRIAEADHAVLRRRHRLQENAFDLVAQGDIQAWHSFLERHFPEEAGPPWKFYGKGFLLTDLQFWSES